jgi:hypothetical protein
MSDMGQTLNHLPSDGPNAAEALHAQNGEPLLASQADTRPPYSNTGVHQNGESVSLVYAADGIGGNRIGGTPQTETRIGGDRKGGTPQQSGGLDYLRLTSFDTDDRDAWREWALHPDTGLPPWDDWKGSRRRQYRGLQAGQVFMGHAVQCDRPHFQLDIAGPMADDAWHYGLPGKPTRIDLQVSIPLPAGYSSRDLYDLLDAGDWRRRRTCRLLQNDDGLDTVYVGSRDSDRLLRIYVKQVTEGPEGRWLRFEAEFKGDAAVALQPLLTAENEAYDALFASVLAGELGRLPQPAQDYLTAVRQALGAGQAFTVPRARGDDASRLRWLRQTVYPVIFEVSRSHEHGYTVLEEILSLLPLGAAPTPAVGINGDGLTGRRRRRTARERLTNQEDNQDDM